MTSLTGARVLVTGGAGLIGAAIARHVRASGGAPIVLDDLSGYDAVTYQALGLDPDLVVGDINDESLMGRLTRMSDFVVHAAAFSTVAGCTRDPDQAFQSNLSGTHQVLRAAAREQVKRLIFISSAQVYGHGVQGLDQVQHFVEDQPMSPLNPYAAAKLWGESHTRHLLDAAGVDYTIVRPFSVYGERQIPKPGAWSWVVAQFCMYATLGQPLPLNNSGRQVRDFVHVDDAAEGICRALVAPRAGGATINIGSGRTTSILQVAELVRDHLPDTAFQAAPRPLHDPLGGCADIARMTEVLGWQPAITVADGVDRYLNWLRETPEAIPVWLPGERDRVSAWNSGVTP
ncbi:NAD-dependent epimerase/dehydratase family protein [Nonomuraea sp. NPDC050556]|uniref:NAD-dependent epimerase/dehydratase family protein n=1 Tax=Nonomuraea sp. NPDC050556 TaxID=3364369 RepID=UPI0037A6561D